MGVGWVRGDDFDHERIGNFGVGFGEDFVEGEPHGEDPDECEETNGSME
jgi:hypothetical protein